MALRTTFPCVDDHNNDHLALHRRYNQARSVRDYGALGDGVTDDTAAFQAAIDASEPRDTLYIPHGEYQIFTGLTSDVTNLSLIGDGRWASRIIQSRPNTINLLTTSAGLNMSNLFFRGSTGSGAIYAPTGTRNDSLIEGCWFYQTDGPLITGRLNNFTVSDCIFEGSVIGIDIIGQYVNISNCLWYNVKRRMLKLTSYTGANLSNLFFEVRDLDASIETAVQLINCDDINMSNLNFVRVDDADGGYPGAISMSGCTGVHMSNVRLNNFVDGVGPVIDIATSAQILGRNISAACAADTVGISLDTCTEYNIEMMVVGADTESSEVGSVGVLTMI